MAGETESSGARRGGRSTAEARVVAVEVGPEDREGYLPVSLRTSRGHVDCRHYAVPGARTGAIWVGGVGGGWDAPARGLYPRLCRELMGDGITSLRVRFRYSTRLEEAVFDVLAGLDYLESQGIDAVALTGHSFGGAVVIRAAAASPAARAVVTLATQGYGAEAVGLLAPRCPILLIHGTRDRVLPPSSSEHVYEMAGEPKQLRLFDGAGHGLDEAAGEVERTVRGWIVARLSEATAAS